MNVIHDSMNQELRQILIRFFESILTSPLRLRSFLDFCYFCFPALLNVLISSNFVDLVDLVHLLYIFRILLISSFLAASSTKIYYFLALRKTTKSHNKNEGLPSTIFSTNFQGFA